LNFQEWIFCNPVIIIYFTIQESYIQIQVSTYQRLNNYRILYSNSIFNISTSQQLPVKLYSRDISNPFSYS